jgi:hypothetical protein
VKRLPGSDQHVEGREERYLLSRPSRFAGRHSRHRLDIVAVEGAHWQGGYHASISSDRHIDLPPTASDIAPREEGILGIKATK